MELKIEIEIGLSESTKSFIADLFRTRVTIPAVKEPVLYPECSVEELAQAVAAAAPVAEKPAKAEKKTAKATKKSEPVESPAEPEQPAKPADTAPAEEPVKPADTVDYVTKRKEIKAYCAKRKAEGVNIPELIFQFLGKKGARFSEIPDEKLEEFAEIVKAAEVA